MVVPDRYDDGGFTRTNTDRPAIRRLMAERVRRRYRIPFADRGPVERRAFPRFDCGFASLAKLFTRRFIRFPGHTGLFVGRAVPDRGSDCRAPPDLRRRTCHPGCVSRPARPARKQSTLLRSGAWCKSLRGVRSREYVCRKSTQNVRRPGTGVRPENVGAKRRGLGQTIVGEANPLR